MLDTDVVKRGDFNLNGSSGTSTASKMTDEEEKVDVNSKYQSCARVSTYLNKQKDQSETETFLDEHLPRNQLRTFNHVFKNLLFGDSSDLKAY